MRMRHKKNLESRLEAVSDWLLDCTEQDLNTENNEENLRYYNLEQIFGNTNPVYLEIGCGKGQFIRELAARHPENNYIACEKVANVIVTAAEHAKEDHLTNVRFMKCGAEYLPRFLPPASISGIYLNFSCPYPKNSYANHRLTNERYLESYKKFMAPGAEIHQKTDNMHFFEYSIECFTACGFALKNVSLDLHHSDFTDNIVTEYEARFSAQGLPIYRLEAYLPEQPSKEETA